MFKRQLTPYIQQLASKYPVVTLLGPRQSGKTTLVKAAFPQKPYVNMEDADNRSLASLDPKSFMQKYPNGAILDEVQRTPHLLSYIQVRVDEVQQNGMFILTGSHQAELHSAVSQSLAGRTSLLRLLPLSLVEMRESHITSPIEEIILKGGYPKIYKENLPLSNAYSSYFQTYVERDVRQILQIKDILQFERFIKLTASRIGQLINYASLASDVGVSAVTIKEWISVLEATYILIRLEPYFENFGKRLIKSPKLYFADTGLACHLLGIDSVEQLIKDPFYGNLFENWIVVELMKARYNQAKDPRLYFYRDVTGREVDLLLQQGSQLIPIEIKSSKTFSPSYLEGLQYFHQQTPQKAIGGTLIYAGEKFQKIGNFELLNPENCFQLMN
ncbi:MAG: ATP-binding protein [Parachlamydiales bacterium]|nr:ATP-binding protein [Verrucomicrobiota bacterium]MBX3719309.1 ATP-binding protein [Candidatus Acheromyda pituitae]